VGRTARAAMAKIFKLILLAVVLFVTITVV
jgi:hypothetical protein